MTREYKITDEEHRWTTDFKIEWLGYGEWLEELDRIDLEYEDYKAEVFRLPPTLTNEKLEEGGILSGYVSVPKSHPYYGNQKKFQKIECQGGLNYNLVNQAFVDIHIIGFYCATIYDYFPSLKRWKEFRNQGFVYRNMEFCIEECLNIIDQLIEMENGEKKLFLP